MTDKLNDYLKYLENIDLEAICGYEDFVKSVLIQIYFFQHERLIHLIVTSLFAILEVMFAVALFIVPNYATICLNMVTIPILVMYILHYYTLENGVQKLYDLYDKIVKHGVKLGY